MRCFAEYRFNGGFNPLLDHYRHGVRNKTPSRPSLRNTKNSEMLGVCILQLTAVFRQRIADCVFPSAVLQTDKVPVMQLPCRRVMKSPWANHFRKNLAYESLYTYITVPTHAPCSSDMNHRLPATANLW